MTGTSAHSIKIGGRDRSYRLYKPAGLPASAPLVVMLHGAFGKAKRAEKAYSWDELANSQWFLVAYPDGLNRSWNVNGGGCCGPPARDGVDDVAFITAVVEGLRHRHQQRRHHVLHAGLQYKRVRRDRP